MWRWERAKRSAEAVDEGRSCAAGLVSVCIHGRQRSTAASLQHHHHQHHRRTWNVTERNVCSASDPAGGAYTQGRRHGVDWGGHIHPTFARGRSWNWCKSGEFLLGRRGVGHGLELTYVKFKVTITEFAYKSGRHFEEKIRHSTVIASGIAYTLQRYWRVSVWTVCIMTYLLTLLVCVTYNVFPSKYRDWSKFAASIGHQELKGFQTPVVGSRSPRSPSVSTPLFFTWRRPRFKWWQTLCLPSSFMHLYVLSCY